MKAQPMNSPFQYPDGIRPEVLADCLAKAALLKLPEFQQWLEVGDRRKEMLWFIQAMDMAPGGRQALAGAMLAKAGDRIGTEVMRKIGVRRGMQLSLEDKQAIVKSLPEYLEERIARDAGWPEHLLGPMFLVGDREPTEEHHRQLAHRLKKLEAEWFMDQCGSAAKELLPDLLAMICHGWPERAAGAPLVSWCFQDLPGAILEAMETQAVDAGQRLARTEVARQCFDALDYAWSEKVLVQIEGDSRFGKSEAIKTWCAMYPGRARLVTVPCSNSEADLHRAVADALGIEHSLATSPRALKEAVEFTVRHAGLMLVFDEGHWLLPTRYTSNTPPMRLNWVRTRIVDQGLPCVIVSTPQAFRHSVKGFVKRTGFNMEQILGRRAMVFTLPLELDKEDLLSVARIHFPQLGEDYLLLIVAKAMQSENYLQAVEAIATRARYLSRRAGRSTVNLAHVDQAIADVFPAQAPSVVAQATQKRVSAKGRAAGLQESCTESIKPDFGREMRPAVAIPQGAERPDMATRAMRRDAALLRVADS